MIVLDTNVLSELMRADPHPAVLQWVDARPAMEFYLTSITVAEVLYGLARMPEGRRRMELAAIASVMFEEDFSGRVLSFDQGSAVDYAVLVIERERRGRPISMADAQIAAICRRHDASLATRNGRDFEATGVVTIDPWSDDRS